MKSNLAEELQRRFKNFNPPGSIKSLVRASITRNFQTGGNYGNGKFGGGTEKWVQSKRAIKQHGRTLRDTGRLLSSINYEVSKLGNGTVRILVSSNSKYAAIHNEGGTINMPARSNNYTQNRYTRGKKLGRYKKGTTYGNGTTRRPYVIKMPRRPFMVLQDYDIADIEQAIVAAIIR